MSETVEFANDFYQSISTALANRRAINIYRQVPDGPSLSSAAMLGSAGIIPFADLSEPVCRGLFSAKKRGFSVNDETLYEVFENGTDNPVGDITGEKPVRFAFNGFTLVIISDNKGYFYSLADSSYEEITDPIFSSFGKVIDVTYKDGYFFYMTEEYIFNGSLVTDNDGKDFPALSFGSAEVEPDGNTAIHTSSNQLYGCGLNTIQVFESVGGTGFPLQNIQGATIQKGVIARDTVIDYQGYMTFLGGDEGENPALYLVRGSSIQKVTTPAIENYIENLGQEEIEQAVCWVYQQSGSNFLVLDIGSASFVYDMTASQKTGRAIWHERKSGITTIEDFFKGFSNWRARFSMRVFGKTIVGDRTTLSEIEMICEVGVGNSDSKNPQLQLSYSDDQGIRFTAPVSRSLGAVGNTGVRLIWRRFRQFQRDRVIRFYTDDPVKLALIRMDAEVS